MYEKLFPATHHFYPLQQYTCEDSDGFADFKRTLRRGKDERTDNLIYVHLPYCEKQCLFCPFHVRVTGDKQVYSRYTEALCDEIRLVSSLPYVRGMDFAAIYFGGGSPSMFPKSELIRLFSALRASFQIREDAEWTFEGEPHSLLESDLIPWLAQENIERISYGVQTFDTGLRERLNIAAKVEDTLACLELARKHQIREVNVDMMFHLPGHSLKELSDDIQMLGDCHYDSVDYYYLSYFGFPRRVIEDMARGLFPARPAEELRSIMGRRIREDMVGLGYQHVTDHVFSRRHFSSEYYRILWGGGEGEYRAETVALGSSARGYIDGVGYANVTDPVQYIRLVKTGELPLFKVSARLKRPQNRGLVFFPKFFRLRKKLAHLSIREQKLFAKWVDAGYLVEKSDVYELTELGKDWIPNITMDLFEERQRAIAIQWMNTLTTNYRNRVTQ